MRVLFFIIFYFSFALVSFGQSEKQENYGLAVVARAQEKRILLRWAPKTAVDWQLLNKYGYRLERYTIVRDSVVLSDPEKVHLDSSDSIKPKPLPLWEEMVEEDDYAGIAAQAIYGETFEINMDNGSNLMQIINKVRESEARYSYTLFAADQSFEVALMSGLAYVDVTARKNEKYLYRIYSNVPENIEKIDFGFIYKGLDDYQTLPKPYGLQADFADKIVALKWERANFDHIYNSWWVEKSSDGKSYSRITGKAIVDTNIEKERESRYMYKIDSLKNNSKTYYYRVRGVTSFGELSPPSNSVSGFGIKSIEYTPAITATKVIDNSKVQITWSFSPEGKEQITGFKIERSNSIDGIYEEIGTYSNTTFETIDDQPLPTNYYRAKAFNQYNMETTSFPVLAQLQDSIPPSIPVNLDGKVDSLGMVNLFWQPNKENDLLGYRVYRSNFKNAEFSQITTEPVTEPYFMDSITSKTLTSAVYYRVLAVDQRFNPSDLSAILTLRRPDIIPPVPPIFTGIKSDEKGITLNWVNSSSEDVIGHHLYRRLQNFTQWSLIETFDDTTSVFVDSTLQISTAYQYTLIAIDKSSLESEPCKPVWGKVNNAGSRPDIETFTAKVDRTSKEVALYWKYDHKGVEKFSIYRAKADEPISLYKNIKAESIGFIDYPLEDKTEYTYRIKAIYKDGGQSPFSKEIRISD